MTRKVNKKRHYKSKRNFRKTKSKRNKCKRNFRKTKSKRNFRKTKTRQRGGAVDDLIIAARDGEAQEVKRLLRDKRVNRNIADEANWTPLMWAASNGHADVVEVLLRDKRVDIPDSDEEL